MASDVAQLEEYFHTIPSGGGGPPHKTQSGCGADFLSCPWERWGQKDQKFEGNLIRSPYSYLHLNSV